MERESESLRSERQWNPNWLKKTVFSRTGSPKPLQARIHSSLAESQKSLARRWLNGLLRKPQTHSNNLRLFPKGLHANYSIICFVLALSNFTSYLRRSRTYYLECDYLEDDRAMMWWCCSCLTVRDDLQHSHQNQQNNLTKKLIWKAEFPKVLSITSSRLKHSTWTTHRNLIRCDRYKCGNPTGLVITKNSTNIYHALADYRLLINK